MEEENFYECIKQKVDKDLSILDKFNSCLKDSNVLQHKKTECKKCIKTKDKSNLYNKLLKYFTKNK